MTAGKKRVEFSLPAPDAEAVYLVGSFNGWSVGSDNMKLDRKGSWKKTKYLPPGTYEYQFVADGQWMVDPHCAETVVNPYGTLNSIIHVH